VETTQPDAIRILVIEDNPADVELLRMALDQAKLNYRLSVVTDGASALAVLGDKSPDAPAVPDLTVLDLNLPKYDGLELLEAARSNPRFAFMPVAILSSSSSPREQNKIQNFGRVKYITKPSDLDAYLAIGATLRDFLSITYKRAFGA
jgi:CheY-like chemotaxis protein